jgi:hypothetical protein
MNAFLWGVSEEEATTLSVVERTREHACERQRKRSKRVIQIESENRREKR